MPEANTLSVPEKVRKVRLEDANGEKIRVRARPALGLMIELAALTGVRKTDIRLLTRQQVVSGPTWNMAPRACRTRAAGHAGRT